MIEISLHILDIVQNSIKAHAENIEITVYENTDENILRLTICDDGDGMDEDAVINAADPFYTSSGLKPLGLGLSFLKAACENADGEMTISSPKGKGTIVTATFKYDHINRQPLGDMAFTVTSLLMFNLNVGFIYKHTYNGNFFEFNSDDYAQKATEIAISGGDLCLWVETLLNEKINNIYNHSERNE